ncbi:MAG: hypothetical protein H0U10_16110 [Chloroflexia bacterium]|nr:hypothetical protein [Chloroflexia bacterium]
MGTEHPLRGAWSVDLDIDDLAMPTVPMRFTAEGGCIPVSLPDVADRMQITDVGASTIGQGIGRWVAIDDHLATVQILFPLLDRSGVGIVGWLYVDAIVEIDQTGDHFTADYDAVILTVELRVVARTDKIKAWATRLAATAPAV